MTSPQEIMLSLKVGQTILVETKNELLMGIVKQIDTKHLMLELDNVSDMKTNLVYNSTQMLNYHQMISIKVLAPETNNDCSETEGGDTVSRGSSSEKTSKVNSEHCVQLTSLELDIMQTQLESLVYIKQCDQKYHNALQDIKVQSVVGLLIEPVHLGRHCKTSIIALATPSNVYIFDIFYLGSVFREFRQILESQRPRKAVHISHKYLDHMHHRQNVNLTGVFDTFVAHCMITGDKTPKTLEESIQHTFNLSSTYFQTDDCVSLDPNYRPLAKELIMLIAKKTILQLKLCEYLLHEEMLSNFYEQCETFSRTLVNNKDGFEVGQQLHPQSQAAYNHIQHNVNWKDKLQPKLH